MKETETCRQCGAEIPVTPGYPLWCDKCEWNIDPRVLPPKKKAWDKAVDIIARGAAESLYGKLVKDPVKKPGLSVSKILLHVLAVVIHLSNLLLMAGCVTLSVVLFVHFHHFGVVTWFSCLLLLLLAFLLRPRLPKSKVKRASREECPGLHALADKVSDFLGAGRVELAVTADFNAYYAKIGLRKAVVGIGIPLFAALSPDERVAILGHEIAHGVNGDASRSYLVFTAQLVLMKYYEFFYVGSFVDGVRYAGPFAIIWNLIRWLLSKAVLLFWFVLQLFAFRDSQRAEYYADHLGAKVSGSDPAVRALRKLFLALDFDYTVRTTTGGQKIIERFLYRIDRLPDRERERLRRLADRPLFRIDVTHPPAAYRIGFLESSSQSAALALTQADNDAVDADIEKLKPRIEKMLLADRG